MTCYQPEHVGVLAMSAYVPKLQVPQAALEQEDGCVGKYTVGLGQMNMSFCSDREDVISMALTAVQSLLDAHDIDPRLIGRLEVGTESAIDRSKSIKSHLMRIFEACGNHDIEGVDCIHACYAGTAALLSAVSWVESRAWDGRFAIVVCTDVALYAPGCPARATGGAGAVALLVGPDAPLAFDPTWHATYAAHAQEFCKPQGTAPFPVVDGPATLVQYLRCSTLDAWGALLAPAQALQPDPSRELLRALDGPGPNGCRVSCMRPDGRTYGTLELWHRAIAMTELMSATTRMMSPTATTEAAPAPSTSAGVACQPIVHSLPVSVASGRGSPVMDACTNGTSQSSMRKHDDPQGHPAGDARCGSSQQQVRHRAGQVGNACQAMGAEQGSSHPPCQPWLRPLTCAQQPPPTTRASAPGVLHLVDYFVSHAPFNKIVHKGFGRVVNQDALRSLRQAAEAQLRRGGWGGGGTEHSDRSGWGAGTATSSGSAGASGIYGEEANAEHSEAAGSSCSSSQWAMALGAKVAAWVQARQLLLASGDTTRASSAASMAGSAEAGGGAEELRPAGAAGAGAASPPALLAPVPVGLAAAALQAATAEEEQVLWSRLDPHAHPTPLDAPVERQLLLSSEALYNEKAADACWIQQRVGNTYTASLYLGLASLIELKGAALEGKRLLLFAFGSGVMASLFSLMGRRTASGHFTLEAFAQQLNLKASLAQRCECTPAEFAAAAERHTIGHSAAPFRPMAPVGSVAPGVFYLDNVDENYHREYRRRPMQ